MSNLTTDEMAMRKLVRQAIPFVEAARDELWQSFNVHGVVYDQSAKKDLAKFDRWLKKAKSL